MCRPSSLHVVSRLVLAAATLLSACTLQADDQMSRIKSDERVLFFPTAARLTEGQQAWLVAIHGWIFEPEEDDALRGAVVGELRDALGLEPGEASTEVFEKRIRWFLVDNERGKRIGVQIAGEQHVLDPSGANGHFAGTIRLAADRVAPLLKDGLLHYEAVTGPNDRRRFQGVSYCLRPEGVSVVSDIDDTIKVTEVTNKRKMIRNTFLREFHAVEGMPAVYSRWADEGAQFHYVSASPWQLYEPLAGFMQQAGFPQGTVHLKQVRLKDTSVLKLFEDPVQYKVSAIGPLLQAYPNRTFILVGDSGEKDPEAYGIVARRYASQVRRIYIRDVTGDPADGPRYQDAFRKLPADTWHVFRQPSELPAIGKR